MVQKMESLERSASSDDAESQISYAHAHINDAVLENGPALRYKISLQSNWSRICSYKPLRPVITYIDRPALRKQLEAQLHDHIGDLDHETNITLVVGLGGAGKTQLVLSYIERYRQDYSAIFWIDAGSRESIERDIVQIYILLYNVDPEVDHGRIRLEQAIIAVKQWFKRREKRWLFVFDDANAISNPDSSSYVNLFHLLPDDLSVQIVITTRDRSLEASRMSMIEVGEMEPAEAAALFKRQAKIDAITSTEEEQVALIVQELGSLPLATALAGSYVAATPRLRNNLAGYLSEYRTVRRRLLAQRPSRLIHRYDESVLATWEASFRAIEEKNPEASEFLALLTFFKHDDIPAKLPTTSESGDPLPWISNLFPKEKFDQNNLDKIFEILHQFSFIKYQRDRDKYSIHRLVQDWAYDRLEHIQQQKYALVISLLVQTMSGREGVVPIEQQDSFAGTKHSPELKNVGEKIGTLARSADDVHVEQLSTGSGEGTSLLYSLFFRDMHSRRLQLLQQQLPSETCDWIWSTRFLTWSLDPGSRMFWISGQSGSGKSVLMNYLSVYHEAIQIAEGADSLPCPTLSFFFDFQANTDLAKSLEGMYRTLIYQALHHEGFQNDQIKSHSLDDALASDIETFKRILCDLLGSTPSTVRIFIDALDECADGSHITIHAIQDLANCENVKLCVSSRSESVFQHAFVDVPTIVIQKQERNVSTSIFSDSGIDSIPEQYAEKVKETGSSSDDSAIGPSIRLPHLTDRSSSPQNMAQSILLSDHFFLSPEDIERIEPSGKDIGSRKGSSRSAVIKAAEIQLFTCLSQNLQLAIGIMGIRMAISPQDAQVELTEHLKFFFENLEEFAESRLDHACANLLRNHWIRERIAKMLIEDRRNGNGLNGDDEDDDDEQREIFEKSRHDLNQWLNANQAFAQQHNTSLLPPILSEPEDMVDISLLDDIENPGDVDEESAQVFQQIPDYTGQMEAFLLNGEPFRRLLQKLYSQNIRVKHMWLRDLLWTLPKDRIDINLHSHASTGDRIKHLLESATGVQWEWWPHRPPRIPICKGDSRITWHCYCGLVHCRDVPTEDAQRLHQLLEIRSTFDSSVNPCFFFNPRSHPFPRDHSWSTYTDYGLSLFKNLWLFLFISCQLSLLLFEQGAMAEDPLHTWIHDPTGILGISMNDCLVALCICGFDPACQQLSVWLPWMLSVMSRRMMRVMPRWITSEMSHRIVSTISHWIVNIYERNASLLRVGWNVASIRLDWEHDTWEHPYNIFETGMEMPTEERVSIRRAISYAEHSDEEETSSSPVLKDHENYQEHHQPSTQSSPSIGTSTNAVSVGPVHSNTSVSSADVGSSATATNALQSNTLSGGNSLILPSASDPGNQMTPILKLILGMKRSFSHEIDLIDFKDPALLTDDDFLKKLREIRSTRWTILSCLSLFQLHSITFLQFLKEDEHFIGEGDPAMSFPINNPDYSYRGNEQCPPVPNLPPVSEEYFTCFLNRCSSQCTKALLFPWHQCTKCSQMRPLNTSQSLEIVDRIPKKRSDWDHKAAGRELVWGLRWKHKPSWLRAGIYSLLILLGPVVFMVLWEKSSPKDLQSATVPLMVGLGFLQTIWGSVWLAYYVNG